MWLVVGMERARGGQQAYICTCLPGTIPFCLYLNFLEKDLARHIYVLASLEQYLFACTSIFYLKYLEGICTIYLPPWNNTLKSLHFFEILGRNGNCTFRDAWPIHFR